MSSSDEHVVRVGSSVEPATEKKSKKLRKWKWTKIDKTGKIETIELDNYTITQRFHISVRDLRILDRDYKYPSTILARGKAILLQIEYLKMIITAKEVLILEYSDLGGITPDAYYLAFQQKLMSMMSPETDSDTEDELPFEFCALKVVLESFYQLFYGWCDDQREAFVFDLGRDETHEKKSELNEVTIRVEKVCDEIKRLLEDESGLAEFYLSRKLARASSSSGEPTLNPTSPVVDNDVDELQMLLEKYFYEIKSITQHLRWLKALADTKLDEVRNQLIKFELIISSASICLSVFSLVAGILGMNIPYQKDMFRWVVSVTGTICAILFVIIMSYARYKNLVDFDGLVGFLYSVRQGFRKLRRMW